MVRHLAGLAVTLLITTPVWAGELDREFAGGVPTAAVATKSRAAATNAADLAQSTQKQMQEQAVSVKGSELDRESPTQASRAGWGGGRGWGWGGGRGWGWGGRGWGWGGGRGWGWGGRGWGWGWGGWGWGWPRWGWGWGYPYYASAYAYAPSAYPYYPSYGYLSAGYTYPDYGW